MGFEFEGFEEFAEACNNLADDMKEIREEVPEMMDEAVEHSAEELEEGMKSTLERMGAVDSGELLNSIVHGERQSAQSGGKATWVVGPTADHAKWVEYGTGLHGPRGEKYAITPKGTSEEEVRSRREMEEESEDDSLSQESLDAPALQFQVGGTTITRDMVMHPGSEAQPFVRNSVRRHAKERRLSKALDKQTGQLFGAKME